MITGEQARRARAARGGVGAAVTAARALTPIFERAVTTMMQPGASRRALFTPEVEVAVRNAPPNGGGRRQARRARQRSQQQLGPVGRLPRGPPATNSTSARMTFKDVFGIADTAAGVSAYYVPLGISTTLAASPLGVQVPRLGTVSGCFKTFYINTIKATFVPNSGYTTGGSVCIGFDSDPLSGTPIGYGGVVRHMSNVFGDIKDQLMVTYRPGQDGKNDPKQVTAAAGRDEDALSFGVLQLYSANTQANQINIGNLFIEVDVSFIGAS